MYESVEVWIVYIIFFQLLTAGLHIVCDRLVMQQSQYELSLFLSLFLKICVTVMYILKIIPSLASSGEKTQLLSFADLLWVTLEP